MVIGIDAREIQYGVSTGIGRALDNFLQFFGGLDDEHRCVLFSESVPPVEYGTRIQMITVPPAIVTVVWDQIVLPRQIRKYRIDRFYSPYYKVPLFTRVPVVSTVFDLMYIYYPVHWKGTGRFSRWYYRVFGGLMAQKAQTIFTCSEYSKTEIIRFYKVSPEKVQVIHLGLSRRYRPIDTMDDVESVKRKYGIGSSYLLYTGNFKPHKNVAMLIAAFEQVHSAVPGLQLVLAGDTRRYFDTVARIIKASLHASAIIVTGRVALEEQVALYQGATVFVCPSLYEGFGYPPIEAMACGTPVVSSPLTSLDEIIGDAALRCDPADAADMAEKIIRVIADNDLQRQLSSKGLTRAGLFSNERFCEQFYHMLGLGG